MIDRNNVPPVDPEEMLARFIFSRSHIRSSNGTVKADAFIPHPHAELSVTRHRDTCEGELWEIGRTSRKLALHGRGDVSARTFVSHNLTPQAAPVFGDAEQPDNPNHTNVTGWPVNDKAKQRLIALEISEKAKLVRYDG